MKDNKGFWDRWVGRYDRLMSGDKDTYARIVNCMKKKLNRNMYVPELACGTGILSVQLAVNVKMLESTDFSEDMIKQAKRKKYSSRLHFSVQDVAALPYASETFDAVVISNALHIMPQPEKSLAEIKRVLKPDGILFAPTFTVECWLLPMRRQVQDNIWSVKKGAVKNDKRTIQENNVKGV